MPLIRKNISKRGALKGLCVKYVVALESTAMALRSQAVRNAQGAGVDNR
jgi:hypothetical protein